MRVLIGVLGVFWMLMLCSGQLEGAEARLKEAQKLVSEVTNFKRYTKDLGKQYRRRFRAPKVSPCCLGPQSCEVKIRP